MGHFGQCELRAIWKENKNKNRRESEQEQFETWKKMKGKRDFEWECLKPQCGWQLLGFTG